MPAVQKINDKTLKAQANEATKNDVSDIFASIKSLGNPAASSIPVETRREVETPVVETKPLEPKVKQIETVAITESKDDKPGYISLVIPNSLKKKWKLYCMQHELSLTDCIKIAMKNLEEMEKNDVISIEDGIVMYRGR